MFLAHSASFADAFDLFINNGILRTLGFNRVIALHSGPRRHGTVDAPSDSSASRISRGAVSVVMASAGMSSPVKSRSI